jgi:poly[(R)-3-hydroxyalkanoate] polymerase subunit PhaC
VTKQEETTTEHRVKPSDEAFKAARTNLDQLGKEPDPSLNLTQELVDYSKRLETCRKTLHLAGKTIKVGTTPNEILHETRNYSLLHFRPMTTKTFPTPILVVYALMNKSYILDLQPGKSWIQNLLRQGFDVYLINWNAPLSIDKYISFDDYVNYFLDDCIEKVNDDRDVESVTLHGYCLGATMSVMYTATHQEKVRNLVTIAPIIDADQDSTVLANFAKNINVDKLVDTLGNFTSEQLYACYSMLKPFKQGVNKYINLVQNIDNKKFVENFLGVEKWLYDTPPIAGETFRQWIKDIYQNNLLAKNEMRIRETSTKNDFEVDDPSIIDLSKIRVPLLNIVAEEDHLVAPASSSALNDLVSSKDKRLMRFHTGHVGLIASSYSQNNVLPKVGQWIKSRSQ